ncbi:response regulator transcription factor [Nocardia otitidiscaviarum]|uniref:Response regulator transcription factor n=2 Tax=Nocardia TaxID=1817 RepID=A0A516NH07_9NOCA|nr:LuxR C-terminal-related transcriptional regulator [Nocardia otitidiscaviarum]MCP9619532.1 LuxR C-terminal-related transcriptional regulator [Nocardia otitidiscaviarum]QDP78189.1 response regulator transcription factor [Nocardia otitidiscaviarum]
MAGIAATELPGDFAEPGASRRIGYVEDHQATAVGLAAVLGEQPDLAVTAIAPTVPELLARATDLDLVVLSLVLADGSTPRANITTLRERGLGALIYTAGERRDLIRAAARAGALGVALKSDPVELTVAMVRAAAAGRPVPTASGAPAVGSDPGLGDIILPTRQREVLELYANGETAGSVARRLGLSEYTVNDYLGRIRRKYAEAGRPVRTRVDLYREAARDGFLRDPRHRA